MKPAPTDTVRSTASSFNSRIATFLGLLSIGLTALHLFGGAMPGPLASLAVMCVPMLSAFGAASLHKDPIRAFGWRPGRVRFLITSYIVPFVYVALAFAITLLVGSGTLTMQWWPGAAGHLGLPATAAWGFAMLATINVVFAMIPALGEEIGWRGYLVPLLSTRFRFPAIVLLSWAIWLGFHAPGLLTGAYGASGVPVWLSTLDFAAMLLPLAAFMAWLRMRSGSIWPCVLAHGAHNAFVGEMFASAILPDKRTALLFGEFGVLMPITASLAVWTAIALLRPRNERAVLHGAAPPAPC